MSDTTLRLVFPQWQGGGNPAYGFGTELLEWLAPAADGPVEHVAVAAPDGRPLPVEDGILARGAIVEQLGDARRRIDRHRPDRIVVLGGDCLVDLAPFAYLNERYDGDLAVLWVDTHPDVMTKEVFPNAHAHVMGALLGEGDPDLVGAVKRPVRPENVMFAGRLDTLPGLPEVLAYENAVFSRLGLRSAGPEDLAETSEPVLRWLRETGARHLAIHFDLDVLDPQRFRSLGFANPDPAAPEITGVPTGRMTMSQIVRLLRDVAAEVDVVGLGITEHLPWDSMALRDMLRELPLIGRPAA